MPRRSLAAVAALLTSLVPAAAWAEPPAPAAPRAGAPPAPATLVIEGKGFGHGVGMAQDGAYAMAAAGASAAAILSHFYPGTAIGRRSGTVRVGVYDAAGPVAIVLPSGGEVRDAPSGAQSPGFPVTVNPGGRVALSIEGGKYKVTPVSGAAITRPTPAPAPAAPAPAPAPLALPGPATPTASASPATPGTTVTTSVLDPLLQVLLPTTVPPAAAKAAPAGGAAAGAAAIPPTQTFALTTRGLWTVPKGDSLIAVPETGRSYRGTVLAGPGSHGIALTDELDVEQYVRGMGEMPASWPAAALQAQAIAARTYALRAAASGRTLCDDQQCQVYIGAGNEAPSTSAAAAATKGQVVTFQGGLADTVYSASGGGISATAEEGFGPDSPDLAYLKPVSYPIADPQQWATTIPLPQLGGRFGYRGELRDVRVSKTGPSGRPLEITFDGETGPMPVDAHRFWSVLDLRSTLYTLRVDASAPEPQGEVAEPLAGNARLSDVSGLAGGAGSRAGALVARRGVSTSLGRTPWVGLAVLLLSMWANAAFRVRQPKPALAPAGEAEGDVGSGDADGAPDPPG